MKKIGIITAFQKQRGGLASPEIIIYSANITKLMGA
jgi:hypothetical protein